MNHAYTAGLIDGEGTIGIGRTQADTYAIRVAVGMTDVATSIIRMLEKTYGGRINPMKPDNERCRPKLRWAVEGDEAAAVLESVLPHLILKREQAKLALTLQDRITAWRTESGRCFWNHPRRHEAEILKQRLNEMNQRGVVPPTPAPLPNRPVVAVRRWGAWWEPHEDLFGPVPFSGKLPSSGSMRAGRVYPAAPSPVTAETSPGLPTPRARDWKSGGKDGLHEATVALFPTPRASDGEKGGPNQRGSKGDLALPAVAAQLLPTPRATDTGTPGRRASEGFRPPLSQVVLPLLPTPRTSDSHGGGSTVTEGQASGLSSPPLLPTPTANLAINGGTQHPAKRRAGGHQPSVADVIEHLGADTPPPSTAGKA